MALNTVGNMRGTNLRNDIVRYHFPHDTGLCVGIAYVPATKEAKARGACESEFKTTLPNKVRFLYLCLTRRKGKGGWWWWWR